MDDFQISKKTKPRSTELTPEQDRDAMLADLALRTTMLEMGVI